MGLYSRNDWILNSFFHPLTSKEVLETVEKRVKDHLISNPSKKIPVVLLDLDSTLYEVSHRTLAIIQEWNKSPKAALKIQAVLNKVTVDHIGYSLNDLAENLGLEPTHPDTEIALKELKPFWWDRFFTNDYLPHDKPYAGAAEYTQGLFEMGAHLVYLTGREHTKMHKVTVENLKRDRFPWCDQKTTLVMKPNGSILDVEHKKSVKDLIAEKGELIASFENEPINLVALSKTFPEAMHIFMDTIYSNNPSEPGKNLFRITGFTKKDEP